VIFTVIVLVMIYEVFFVLIPYQRRIDEERAFLLQTSKLASLGEMSAGIAHEINNPLAIISSSLQLIGRNHTDKDKLERSLDKANRSIDRIAKIISGLKKFSRKSNKLEIESYSLKTLIEESVELASAKSNRHKVDVLYGEMEDFQVDCDETQFSQVLTNLIGNGIDAVSGNENPWVKVSYRVLEDFVQIRIQDSGKGIKAQTVAKLFDPFFTTKQIGKGTGLGLSISKGIIESHGGSLDYELFEGHTSFLITLSRKNSAQAA
jgi:C4-dicarboxylate-specific signal transduction histidine kinase